MILPRTKTSRFRMLVVLALAATVLSACTPGPEPTPTPTALFASEEEAFAAAEETYRAFTAALNEIDLSDPATFESLFELSSGSFESSDRETYSRMHAEGYTLSGDTEVIHFTGKSSTPLLDSVVAEVCLDVSDVEITDEAGASQVNPNRPDVYAIEITFVSDDGNRLLIDSAAPIGEDKCST